MISAKNEYHSLKLNYEGYNLPKFHCNLVPRRFQKRSDSTMKLKICVCIKRPKSNQEKVYKDLHSQELWPIFLLKKGSTKNFLWEPCLWVGRH